MSSDFVIDPQVLFPREEHIPCYIFADLLFFHIGAVGNYDLNTCLVMHVLH